ncbi:MAG: beta-xylosidase [Chloroflexota bacterium]|nr:beta-xylosidase [Chloroflexota bacterium]
MQDIRCDFSKTSTPLVHVWEHTVGSGHATLGLRADWQKQLKRCHEELGFGHVRFHSILSDYMGTLLCENEKLLYSFFNTDQIIDFLLEIGMRPFIELSFMPETLASGSKTVFHYHANVTPPKDYRKWAALINKLITHWVERYGVEEVRRWFFEVWNEPNLDAFWTGTQDDYFRLYRYTVEAVKRVDPALRVGGPVTAKNAWIEDFVAFCDKEDLSADFISTHLYPTDPFGKVGDDTETQLAHSNSDVMTRHAEETKRWANERPVYYTEWSISSNPRGPLHDEPFAAALATKIMMGVSNFVDGYSWWTFSDIFEENYFPSVPFQGGFGLLNLQGIAKPVYRAFELLHHLGNESLMVTGAGGTVNAWAVRKEASLTLLLTNHAMPRHSISTEEAHIVISNAPKPHAASIQRIDNDHANPKRLWQEMGGPEYPDATQVDLLQSTSQLVKEPLEYGYEDGSISLQVSMAPCSVTAVTIDL